MIPAEFRHPKSIRVLMKQILGILGLLLFVIVGTALMNDNFLSAYNIQNTVNWTALFGIISIGVAFVIITGGIDLSIGSVIGLTGVLLTMFLSVSYEPLEEEFTVDRVIPNQQTLLLYGETAALKPGDKLAIEISKEPRNVRELRITSIDRPDENPNGSLGRIKVEQPVGWVRPHLKVTVLSKTHMNRLLAVMLVMLISAAMGLIHGLLITKVKLQPFVVTLCGLLIYRGVARWLTGDETQGFGGDHESLRSLATGKMAIPFVEGFKLPYPFLIMIGLAIVASIFLNRTIYGRYMQALGRNEQAARYSGINTDRMVILAYVICSLTAGLGGVLFALDINSVAPSVQGNFYELYAIAAAVLGGCSLRGGEGSILGVVIGAAVMRVLYNSINLLGIPTQLEFAIIGIVLLCGVIVDEAVKMLATKRRAMRQARTIADSMKQFTKKELE